MSNIYEALEQAQREKTEAKGQLPAPLPEDENRGKKKTQVSRIPTKARASGISATDIAIDDEMFCLYQNIDFLLPDTPEKTIMFIGAQGAEGVSTVVREFARMAATRLDKTVLIMDAAHMNPTQHLNFNFKGGQSWKDTIKRGESLDKACHRTGNPNIFIAPFAHPTLARQPYDHPAATSFLHGLQKKFDLILIDCSPAASSPDSIAISRCTDGVILVMEAERTRYQVVENIRNKIVRNGGNVLGVVFNKRRYHIPDFLYNRL